MSKQNTSSKKKSRKRNQAPSHNTKKKLIQFFIKTAELQRKLQIIKEMLAEEPQFTPTSLFHRFDSARKKFITEKDIEDFLIDSGINFKGSELKTLFGRIDVNQNQSISLRQFQNFILPNQNPQLRYEVVRRPVIIPRPHEKLNQKIEWIISKFFTQIIKQYGKLSQYNTSLVNSYDFDADSAFDVLSNEKGQITGQTIDAFMRQNNEELSKQELGCLIKLIDKKGQAKIHRGDFKTYLATLNLKKQHQIFDELSPIPALKDFTTDYIDKAIKERDRTLKERYKDNKSYVKGMDDDGHHIMGYSRYLDSSNEGKSWLYGSRKRN